MHWARADTAGFPKCSIGSSLVSCPPGSYSYACAIYRTPPAETLVADANGLCMEKSACLDLATTLPGGIDCFDSKGTKLNP